MGGFGSTRWRSYRKKTKAEGCPSLTISQFVDAALMRPGIERRGRLFPSPEHPWDIPIAYEVNALDMSRAWLRLSYCVSFVPSQSATSLDYCIRIVTSRPYFGGWRWWFICPLVLDGKACQSRVAKLYLPPGYLYYGCRNCYGLTYASVQERDKRTDMFLENPKLLLHADRLSVRDQFLALKFIRQQERRFRI